MTQSNKLTNSNSKVKGYISNKHADSKYSGKSITEMMKGEITDDEIQTPKGLGAPHPFDFVDIERTYKKVGFVGGACNKIRGRILGDFMIRSKSQRAQNKINEFMRKSMLSVEAREWILDAVIKGNGFMELDIENEKVQVHNANNMYVKRKKNGKVKEYNQFIGKMNNFSRDSNKFKSISPERIVHLKINQIAGNPYGYGFIWCNERVIENTILNEQDLQKLISRKAGAPIHAKVGVPGESVNPISIDKFDKDLTYMNNKTEWTTDANVDINVVDFGNIEAPLTNVLDHNIEMFSFGMEIPLALLGKGSIPEGLAKVQGEDLQRKIQSIREEIELIISQKLFRPLLEKWGIDEEVEFIWNLPGEDEKNKRIEQIQKLLNIVTLDENMRRLLQLELVNLLNLEENSTKYLPKPDNKAKGKTPKDDDGEGGTNGNGAEKENNDIQESKERDKVKETPPCRKKGETKEDCVSRKIPEIKREDPNRSNDQAVAMAYSMCSKACSDSACKTPTYTETEESEEERGEMTARNYANLKYHEKAEYSEILPYIINFIRKDDFNGLAAETQEDIKDGLLPKKDIKKLKIILREGLTNEKTINQIAEDIEKGIDLKDRTDGDTLLLSKKQRPQVIARTEVVRVSNEGLLEALEDGVREDNENIKVKFMAVTDKRTCPKCYRLNGGIYELKNARGTIPVHPMCRCQWDSVQED